MDTGADMGRTRAARVMFDRSRADWEAAGYTVAGHTKSRAVRWSTWIDGQVGQPKPDEAPE